MRPRYGDQLPQRTQSTEVDHVKVRRASLVSAIAEIVDIAMEYEPSPLELGDGSQARRGLSRFRRGTEVVPAWPISTFRFKTDKKTPGYIMLVESGLVCPAGLLKEVENQGTEQEIVRQLYVSNGCDPMPTRRFAEILYPDITPERRRFSALRNPPRIVQAFEGFRGPYSNLPDTTSFVPDPETGDDTDIKVFYQNAINLLEQ